MAFFTNVVDLEALLDACLTVHYWEMLTEALQIPENFVPFAFARLTELTFHIMFLSELSALLRRERELIFSWSSFPLR